jgi:WS/DGAT/MGAT family acyltransferase
MHPVAERMSRVDTAWLRMDSGANQMTVVGVLLLEPALPIEALRERVRERLLPLDRFRQRVEHDAIGALWVEDDDFDLDRHLLPATLTVHDGQSEREALQSLCALLASVPLDERYPLWQMQLVEHYAHGSALIVRVHHCIADGIALVSVLLNLTDGGHTAKPRRRPARPAHADDGTRGLAGQGADWFGEAVLRPLSEAALRALDTAGGAASPAAGLQVLQDVAEIALMDDDSPTALKGHLTGEKCVAWGDPLPLDTVKAVAKALGCSVNDVLLSCAAGAIGQWLGDARGESTRGKSIRAMVPVNLRPLDQAWQLGNRFGLVPLMLPIGLDNPVERVYAVHARMRRLKGSAQPMLAYAVLSVSGLLVKPVQDSLLNLFARKATAVMTNVPGPQQPLMLCGSTLMQPLFWVPATGDIAVGLSILSYAGGVHIGLITDEARCNDPQAVVDAFAAQFERLLLVTLMLPCVDELEMTG